MPDWTADELALRNGERILVRPIRPADSRQLAELHSRLSPDSIYWRYFGFKPHLSPAEIQRFTSIDKDWRFALVGLRSTGELVGVARYEGEANSADAEIALIVDDVLQREGLGSSLLRRLIDIARLNGIASLNAVVLQSNKAMLRLLQTLTVPATTVPDVGTIGVTLDLTNLELPVDRSRIATAHAAEAAAIRETLNRPLVRRLTWRCHREPKENSRESGPPCS